MCARACEGQLCSGLQTSGSGRVGTKAFIPEKEGWGLDLWVPDGARDCAPGFLDLG